MNNLNDALAWGFAPLYLAAHGASVNQIAVVAAAYPCGLGRGPTRDRLALRLLAERQGLRIVKSRRRDPRAIDYGRWAMFAGDDLRRGNLNIEQVEEYLTWEVGNGPPSEGGESDG